MLPLMIIFSLIGAMLAIIGIIIWKKKKISLLHSYHYHNVKKEDVSPYCSLIGKGLCLMGIGFIVGGVVSFLTNSAVGIIVVAIAFAISLIVMNKAQKKYNGGWF